MVIALGSDTGNVNNNNGNATRDRVRPPIGRLTVEDLKSHRELNEMLQKIDEDMQGTATTIAIMKKENQEMIEALREELFGERQIAAKAIKEEKNRRKRREDVEKFKKKLRENTEKWVQAYTTTMIITNTTTTTKSTTTMTDGNENMQDDTNPNNKHEEKEDEEKDTNKKNDMPTTLDEKKQDTDKKEDL